MRQALEPWYETTGHYKTMARPIHANGRRANLILVSGMAASLLVIPLIALAAPSPGWAIGALLLTCLLSFVAVPAWYLRTVRGRTRIIT